MKGGCTMNKIYGYCRISTKKQSIERQIRNIKKAYPDAIIIEEEYTGTTIDRKKWNKLYSHVTTGDTIIFDEVSRMSRNAAEGYELYMNLMEHGINLIFLKEHHIDTDEYKRRTENHIQKIESQNDNISKLINGILDLVAEFEKENLKDNIRLAFEQAEHERLFLIKR